MNLLYQVAHAGESHSTETEAAVHVASSKALLVAITLVALVTVLIAARFLSAAAKDDELKQKKEEK